MKLTTLRRTIAAMAVAFALGLGAPASAVVTGTASRVDYVGNGSSATFAFTFPTSATDKSWVQVLLGGIVQAAGYTVTLNANQSSAPGGAVTFSTVPPTGLAVRIQRVVPYTQGLSLTPYSAFPARSVESTLDKVTMQGQQLAREQADAISAAAVATANSTAAAASAASAAASLSAGIAATGATLVTASGSPTPRPLGERAGDVVNVKDFGAKGDGTTDDTAAIQAAVNGAASVYIPPGSYKATATIYLPTTPVRLFGHSANMNASGDHAGITEIVVTGTAVSLFKPLVASTYNSISSVQVQLSGLSFQAGYNSGDIVFDRVALVASSVIGCRFTGFKHIIYGTLTGVSSFDRNVVAAQTNSAFKVLDSTDFNPSITAPLVDSGITNNYFNGAYGVASPDFYLLHIPNTNSSFIENNYFDFAYGGVYAGGTNGLVTIRGNTFDILFRAVGLAYGTFSYVIEGNRFFRIRKASAAYFTNPSAAMLANDWTCVWLDQHVRELTVANNVHRDSERFMDLTVKWYKNLREWGTVGLTLTSPVVRLASRTIDEAGYVGIGQSGDGTGFNFESMQMKDRASFADSSHESYEGHTYFNSGVMVTTRGAVQVDANGVPGHTSLWGRTNLAAAGDFSAGWTAGAGFAIAGGVLTLDGTATTWTYSNALGAALQPGAHAIIFRIATKTSGAGTYIGVGVKLNDATIVQPAEVYLTPNAPGTYLGTIVVPAGKTGTNLAIYGGGGTPLVGTLDVFKIIRLTSP